MANFLQEPDIRSLRPQRGSSGSPEASAVSGLADAVSTLSGRLQAKRQKSDAIAQRDESRQYAAEQKREGEVVAQEKGKAIGDATSSLIDLRSERENLLAEERDVLGKISNIYSDDLVTEEEKVSLDNLTAQKDKLDRARKSGVLNETAYNTRYNAMWKQSLSNVSNLALQPEINQIFGSGIATFEEPEKAVDAQMNAQLDQIHGVGNWGVQERGQLLGNQAFVQQKLAQGGASITKLQGSLSNISSAINSTSVNAMLTAVKSNGGVLTDVAKNNYLLAAQSSLSQMEGLYNQRVAESRANGERLDQGSLDKMKEDLDAERKYYLETLPTQLETFGAGEQMEKALKIKQNLIELNRPMSSSANAAFSSGGSSGVGGQITAEKMLDPAFVRNLESLQTGLPIEMMQQAAVDQLVWQFTGDVSVSDMVDRGLVNPELLVLTGSMAINNATVTDGASFDAMLTEVDKYRAGTNLESTDKFVESIGSFTAKARQVSVAAKGQHGNEAAAKGQVGQVLRAQLKRVVEDSRFKNLTISLDENGLPVSFQDKLAPSGAAQQAIRYGDIASLAGRGFAGGDRVKLQQPSKNTAEGEIAALTAAYQEYAKFGLADIRDLQELVTIEGPAEPKAGATGQPDVSGLEDGIYEDDQGNQFTVIGGAIQ